MAKTQTVAERLDRPQQLNSTVRSYSYGEYYEKRANYVGFDKYGAGADWGNLAKALDGFYGEFRHYANDVYLPQWKERGIAEGQEKFNAHSETEGYTKNRLAFKQFVEQHPEMASNNPWVKVGYEQARLNTLSMEMENGLQQAMVENGMMNEEDESKVQQFAHNYMKHFKDQAGLSGYEDSFLLAKNFGSKEAQIFDGAMDRYLHVKNQQMQEKLADATIKEGVAVITNMLNGKSSQGLDPDLPENIDSKNILAVLSGIAERQAGNGLLDSKGKDVIWGMIRSAYAQTNNRNVLKLCENAMFKGTKIIDDPQIAEWYNRTWEHLHNEDARKAREAQAARNASLAAQFDADQYKAAWYCWKTGTDFMQYAEENGLRDKMGDKQFFQFMRGVHKDILAIQQGSEIKSPARNLRNYEIYSKLAQDNPDLLPLRCMKIYSSTGDKFWLDKYEHAETARQKGTLKTIKDDEKRKTDATKDVIEAYKKQLNDNIDVLKSSTPGLSKAINTGLRENVYLQIEHNLEEEAGLLYNIELYNVTNGNPDAATDIQKEQAVRAVSDKQRKDMGVVLDNINIDYLVRDNYQEADIQAMRHNTSIISPDVVENAYPILNNLYGISKSDLSRCSPAILMDVLVNQNKLSKYEVYSTLIKAGITSYVPSTPAKTTTAKKGNKNR